MPFPGSAKDEAPEPQPLPPREHSQDYSGGGGATGLLQM